MAASPVWWPVRWSTRDRSSPSRSRIQVILDPFTGTHTIRYCHQCRRAPCARACPTEAIQWLEEGGFWEVRVELCTGCGACVDACPFGAMLLVPGPTGAVALKCDTCHGEPECVTSCPKGALRWQ